MIGTGLKKLAKENNMRIDAGIAYGNLCGFATAMSEGMGWKQLNISTSFAESGKMETFMAVVQTVNLQKMYRVRNLGVSPAGFSVIFHDDMGTMKKILAFIDWFYPLLAQYGATGAEICRQCGSSVAVEQWYLVNGFAHNLHETCAHNLTEQINQENQERKEGDNGSYGMGAIGAMLGALVGAAVWGLVLYMGYVASLVGLLIGWLANKGYDLLHGKQGKGKTFILIAAVILGVLVGTFGPDIVVLCQMIGNGELMGVTYGDIPYMITYMLSMDSEYARAVGSNVLVGLLFAGLGVFGLLKRTSKEVSDVTVRKLK